MARGTGRRLVALAGCARLSPPTLASPPSSASASPARPRAARPDPREPAGLPAARGQAGHADGTPGRPPRTFVVTDRTGTWCCADASRHLDGAAGTAGSPTSTGSTSAGCTTPVATGSSRPVRSRRRRRGSGCWARAGSSGRCSRYGVAFDQTQRDGRARHPRPAAPPARRTCTTAHADRLPLAAHGARLRPDHRPRACTRSAATVDVSGGWFDAGDYLKFTHSTAYNDVLLFTSARLLGRRAPAALTAEARYGLHWLEKMWDAQDAHALPPGRHRLRQPRRAPSAATTTCGGCPQADDHDHAHQDRYVSHRPVLAAAPAGQPISPNLVGRVVAAFALAAQADAPHHRPAPGTSCGRPRLLYARAADRPPAAPAGDRTPPRVLPGVELAGRHGARRRRARPGRPPPRRRRPAATCATRPRFARRYLDSHSTDTLNLYDTGALADVSLASGDERGPRRGAARGHPPRPDPQPALADPARCPARAPRLVRRGRLGRRVRRQLPHLRAGRHGRAVRRGSPTATASSASPPSSAPGCSAATRGA